MLPPSKWHEDQNEVNISPRARKQDQLYSVHIHNKEEKHYLYQDNIEKGKGDFDTAAVTDRK